MAKKTGEETGTEALDTGTKQLETGTETQTTPTETEQLVALQKELDTAAKERDEYKTGLSTAHSKLTEKDKEIKRQADDSTWRGAIEDKLGLLSAIIAEGGTIPEGGLDDIPQERRRDLKEILDEKTKEIDDKRNQAQAKSQTDEYNRLAWETYTKAKEVFGDDDVKMLRLERFLDMGSLKDAEEMISKVAGKSTDTKGNKVESEEEKINKLVEEQLRQKMEEKGMLASETGGPSGAATSERDAYAKYAAGEITAEEAGKRGVKFA